MAGVYSVSQVNAYIKNMFAQDFALSRISIKGEVSNCKYHTSGHIYFTLKDGLAAIQAVMFASRRGGLDFELRDGQQVVVKGSVEVYERDGRYQLYASQIALDGAGDLFRRFEKLRNELEEMGMFAPEYKRPIPKFARTVGVVTASTGAAIRDIINISSRRNPYVQLVLYPARVQGEGAAESIARGIEVLDRMGLDVIIAGRGGGSIEDLWAFNEEIVARAIFRCSTPVISAVGHETDVTIADYVADLRAPTPSAAAELAVFDFGQFEAQLRGAKELLARGLKRKIDGVRYQTEQYRLKLRLHDPQRQINEKRQRLVSAEDELKRLMERRLSDCRHRLALMSGRLHGQSPLEKLSRGFGFITDEEGRRVDHAASVRPGDRLSIRLADGQIEARAEQTELYERLEVQEES
ncbi:exodeoxyribonuclease VII large subunit [Clostridium sp. M62/1]|uniref:exodeoxyribonuclease VII large subunit n=1 Tax=Clostridium sp. M62/1 TaxID=411486 RepID=UPI0035632886